jgi:hypothetical protein
LATGHYTRGDPAPASDGGCKCLTPRAFSYTLTHYERNNYNKTVMNEKPPFCEVPADHTILWDWWELDASMDTMLSL